MKWRYRIFKLSRTFIECTANDSYEATNIIFRLIYGYDFETSDCCEDPNRFNLICQSLEKI